MAQFYFPDLGRTSDVPDADIERAKNEFGGVPVGPDNTVEMYFPNLQRYSNVPVDQVETARTQYGGSFGKQTPITSDFYSAFPNWVGPEPLNKNLLTTDKGRAYTELQQAMMKGRPGFFEQANIFKLKSQPFVGDALEAIDVGKMAITARKFTNNERVTDEELLDLNLFMLANERSSTAGLWGKVGSIINSGYQFGGEFALTALATGGLGIPALLAKKGATEAAKETGLRAISAYARDWTKKKLEQQLAKRVTKDTAQKITDSLAKKAAVKTAGAAAYIGTGGAIMTGISSGIQLAATGGETLQANLRQLNQYLRNDEDKETYATSLAMGFLTDFIERGSEFAGGYLTTGIGKAGQRIIRGSRFDELGKQMANRIDGVAKNFNMTPPSVTKAKLKAGAATLVYQTMEKLGLDAEGALKWLRRAGYDGVLEEFGEERLAGFFSGLFGTDGGEGGLRAAWEGMIPDSGTDAAAELIAFALPMSYVGAMNKLKESRIVGGAGINNYSDLTRQLREFSNQKLEDTPENKARKEELVQKIVDFSKENPINPVLSLGIDLLTVPFTFNLPTLRYGNADRALAANELPAYTILGKQLLRTAKEAGYNDAQADNFIKQVFRTQIGATSAVLDLSEQDKKELESAGYRLSEAAAHNVDVSKGETGRQVYTHRLERIAGTEAKELSPELRLKLLKNTIGTPQASLEEFDQIREIFGMDDQTFREALQPGANPEATASLMYAMGYNLNNASSLNTFHKSGAQTLDLLRRVDAAYVPNVTRLLGPQSADGQKRDTYVVTGIEGDFINVVNEKDSTDTKAIAKAEVGEGRTFQKQVDFTITPTSVQAIEDTWDNFRKSSIGMNYNLPAQEPKPNDEFFKENRWIRPTKSKRDGKTVYTVGQGANWKPDASGKISIVFGIGNRAISYNIMEELAEIAKPSVEKTRLDSLYDAIMNAADIEESVKKRLSSLSEENRYDHLTELYHKVNLQLKTGQFNQTIIDSNNKIKSLLAFSEEIISKLPAFESIYGDAAAEINEEYNQIFGEGWAEAMKFEAWMEPLNTSKQAAPQPGQSLQDREKQKEALKNAAKTRWNRVLSARVKNQEWARAERGRTITLSDGRQARVDNMFVEDGGVFVEATVEGTKEKIRVPITEVVDAMSSGTASSLKKLEEDKEGTLNDLADYVVNGERAGEELSIAKIIFGERYRNELDQKVADVLAGKEKIEEKKPAAPAEPKKPKTKFTPVKEAKKPAAPAKPAAVPVEPTPTAPSTLKLGKGFTTVPAELNVGDVISFTYGSGTRAGEARTVRITSIDQDRRGFISIDMAVNAERQYNITRVSSNITIVSKAEVVEEPAKPDSDIDQVDPNLDELKKLVEDSSGKKADLPPNKKQIAANLKNKNSLANELNKLEGFSLLTVGDTEAAKQLSALTSMLQKEAIGDRSRRRELLATMNPEERKKAMMVLRFDDVLNKLTNLALASYPQASEESDADYESRMSKIIGGWMSEHLQIAVPPNEDPLEYVRRSSLEKIKEQLLLQDTPEKSTDDPGSVDNDNREDFDSSEHVGDKAYNDDQKMEAVINDENARLFRFIIAKRLGIDLSSVLDQLGKAFNPANRIPGSALGDPSLRNIPFPDFDTPEQEARQHFSYSPEAYENYLESEKETELESAISLAMSTFTYDEFLETARNLGLQNYELFIFNRKANGSWSSFAENKDGLGSSIYRTVRLKFAQTVQTPAERKAFIQEFSNLFTIQDPKKEGFGKLRFAKKDAQGNAIDGVRFDTAAQFLTKWFGLDPVLLKNIDTEQSFIFTEVRLRRDGLPSDFPEITNGVEQAINDLFSVFKNSKNMRTGKPKLKAWRHRLLEQSLFNKPDQVTSVAIAAGSGYSEIEQLDAMGGGQTGEQIDPDNINDTTPRAKSTQWNAIQRILNDVAGGSNLTSRGRMPRSGAMKTTISLNNPMTTSIRVRGWKPVLVGGSIVNTDYGQPVASDDTEIPPLVMTDRILRDIHDNPDNHRSLLRYVTDPRGSKNYRNRIFVPFPRADKNRQFGVVLEIPNREEYPPNPPRESGESNAEYRARIEAIRQPIYRRNMAKAISALYAQVFEGVTLNDQGIIEDFTFKNVADAYKRFGVYNTAGKPLLRVEGGVPANWNVLVVDTGISDGAAYIADWMYPLMLKSMGLGPEADLHYTKGHFVDGRLLFKPLVHFLRKDGLAQETSFEQTLDRAISVWNQANPDRQIAMIVDKGAMKRPVANAIKLSELQKLADQFTETGEAVTPVLDLSENLATMSASSYRETTNLESSISLSDVPATSQAVAWMTDVSVVDNIVQSGVELFKKYPKEAKELVQPRDTLMKMWLESELLPDNFPGLSELYHQSAVASLKRLTALRGAGVSYPELPSRVVSYTPVAGGSSIQATSDYEVVQNRLKAAGIMLNVFGPGVRYNSFIPKVTGDKELDNKQSLILAIARRARPDSKLTGPLHEALKSAQEKMGQDFSFLANRLFYTLDRLQDLVDDNGRVLDQEIEDVTDAQGNVMGWVIRGSFTSVIRVPRSGLESHTFSRLTRPIPGGGSYIITHPEVKKRAGADDDADTRKILFFSIGRNGELASIKGNKNRVENYRPEGKDPAVPGKDVENREEIMDRIAFNRFKKAGVNDIMRNWRNFFYNGYEQIGVPADNLENGFVNQVLKAKIDNTIFDQIAVKVTKAQARNMGLESTNIKLGDLITKSVFNKDQISDLDTIAAMERLIGSSVKARGAVAKLLSLYNLLMRQYGVTFKSASEIPEFPAALRDEQGNIVIDLNPDAVTTAKNYAPGSKDDFLIKALSAYVNIIIDDIKEPRSSYLMGDSEGVNLAIAYALMSPDTDPQEFVRKIVKMKELPAIRHYLAYKEGSKGGLATVSLKIPPAITKKMAEANLKNKSSETAAWVYARLRTSDKEVRQAQPLVAMLKRVTNELYSMGRATDAWWAKAPSTIESFLVAEKDIKRTRNVPVTDPETGFIDEEGSQYATLRTTPELQEAANIGQTVLDVIENVVFENSPEMTPVARELIEASLYPTAKQRAAAGGRAPKDFISKREMKLRVEELRRIYMTEAILHYDKFPRELFQQVSVVEQILDTLMDNALKTKQKQIEEGDVEDINSWISHVNTVTENGKYVVASNNPEYAYFARSEVNGKTIRHKRLRNMVVSSELNEEALQAIHDDFEPAIDEMMLGKDTVSIKLKRVRGKDKKFVTKTVELNRDQVKWFFAAYQSARYGVIRGARSGSLLPILPVSFVSDWYDTVQDYLEEVWSDRSNIDDRTFYTWAKWRIKGHARVPTEIYISPEFASEDQKVDQDLSNLEAIKSAPEEIVTLPNVYKDLPVQEVKKATKHPVHGGVSIAQLDRTDPENPVIRINVNEAKKSFRDKLWTKPRTEGITPLPVNAFTNVQDWLTFLMEHEAQHLNFPRVLPKDKQAYVDNENAINRAAAEALGITERLYPAAVAPAAITPAPAPAPAPATRIADTSSRQPLLSEDVKAILIPFANAGLMGGITELAVRANNDKVKVVAALWLRYRSNAMSIVGTYPEKDLEGQRELDAMESAFTNVLESELRARLNELFFSKDRGETIEEQDQKAFGVVDTYRSQQLELPQVPQFLENFGFQVTEVPVASIPATKFTIDIRLGADGNVLENQPLSDEPLGTGNVVRVINAEGVERAYQMGAARAPEGGFSLLNTPRALVSALATAGMLAAAPMQVAEAAPRPAVEMATEQQYPGSDEVVRQAAPLFKLKEGVRDEAYIDRSFDGKTSEMAVGMGYRLFNDRKRTFEQVTGANFDRVKAKEARLTKPQLDALNNFVMRDALKTLRDKAPVTSNLKPDTQGMLAYMVHWSVYPNKFTNSFNYLKLDRLSEAAREIRDPKSPLYNGERGDTPRSTLKDMAEKLELEAATRINPRTGQRLLTIDAYTELTDSFTALRRAIDNAYELDSKDEREVEDKVQALYSQLIHEELESRQFGMRELRRILKGKKGTYQLLADNIEQVIDTEKFPRESFSVPYKGYDRRGNSLITVTSHTLGAPVSVIEFFQPDMHVRLQDAHRKRMALQNKLSIISRGHALKYGMIENGQLYEIDESGNVRTSRSRGTMTTQDKLWVEDLFSIPAALRESSKLVTDVFQNKKLSKEDKIKRLVKVIESQADFEKEGRKPLRVVHGRSFIDEAGNQIPAVEPIRDLYNRWVAPGNPTREKLEVAGRLESGKTWAEVIAEEAIIINDFFDEAFNTFKTNYWKGYVPRIYGYGREGVQDIQAKDRYQNALDRADADGRLLSLSETELQTRFDGPSPKPTANQENLLKALTREHALLIDPAATDYEGEVLEREDIESLSVWDFNNMILRELESIQRWKAYDENYDPTTPENAVQLNTIKKLKKVLNRYEFKEWTARSFSRKYREEQSYADVFETSRGRIKPNTMYSYNLMHRYTQDVLAGSIHRDLLNQYVAMTDETGDPVVIPVPSEQVDVRELLEPEVLERVARNLAAKTGVSLPAKIPNVKETIQELVRKNLYKEGYTRMESPFPSISEFWVKKGVPTKIMKHMIQPELRLMLGDYDVLQGLMRGTIWSKITSVGWSLFFPFALFESVIAGTGVKNNFLWSYDGKFDWVPFRAMMRNFADVRNLAKQMHNVYGNFDYRGVDYGGFLHELARYGSVDLGQRSATDTPITMLDKDRVKIYDFVRRKAGERTADNVDRFTQLWTRGPTVPGTGGVRLSNYFFDFWFPAMKLWAAKRLADQVAEKAYNNSFDNLTDRQRKDILNEVGPTINDAYGGQFWQRYLWANPRALQILNLLMFAPNWTLSAFNIAGGGAVTGRLLGNYMTDVNKDFVFKTNWPAMFFVVLLALPNAMQFAITAIAGGAGDEDDRYLASLNEARRGGLFPYIDITPLVRKMPNYQGDPTGQRRFYARFGKQAYEVIDGWLTEPVNQFMRKLSQPAKSVWELTTGKSPGSDWNLEFAGQGLMGWISAEKDGEKTFLGSRAGYLVQKVIPISILSAFETPETMLASFIVPTAKGMSFGLATQLMTQAFQTVADDDSWRILRTNEKARRNLTGLVPELVEALERNGYDSQKAIDTARGKVLGRLYKRFLDGLENDDPKKMDRVAEQILRVGGTFQGLKQSINNKRKNYRQPGLEPTEEEKIRKFFE